MDAAISSFSRPNYLIAKLNAKSTNFGKNREYIDKNMEKVYSES